MQSIAHSPLTLVSPRSQGFCNPDIQLTSNDRTWNFAPGTYLFWRTSLAVHGGSITCTACSPGGPGVTFIFSANNAAQVGTVLINTNGVVNLNAPSSGPYSGVLIYRDNLGTSSGNAEIQINGGASTTLIGAVYAPTSSASFTGNATSSCLILVAGEVNLGGTSGFSSVGCPTNMAIPQTQVVRLVE